MMTLHRTARRLFLSTLVMLGCATPEPPPPIDLKPQTDAEDKSKSEGKDALFYLTALERVAPSKSRKGEMTKDLRAFVYLMMSAEKKDQDQLDFYLAEVIKASLSKRISDLAFGQWVRESAGLYPNPPTRDDFVDNLIKRAKKHGIQGFLAEERISDVKSLEREFPGVLNGLVFSASADSGATSQQLSPLVAIEPPKTLNGLYTLAQSVCALKKSDDEVGFKRPLGSLRARLFAAHISLCKSKSIEAIHEYETLAKTYIKSADALYIRYVAWRQLTKIYKAYSRRSDVAQAYIQLTSLDVNPQTLANELDIELPQAKLQLADDLLWACRNNALTGNYQDAERFCHKALDILTTLETTPRLNGNVLQSSRFMRAEAYQTLATRISVEKNDLSGAISYLLIGYNVDHLSDEWRERFLWLLGLYHFVADEKASSIKYWRDLFARTRSDAEKTRLRFWMARAYADIGKKAESQTQMDALLEEDPLSFYAVVAPTLSNLDAPERWKHYFASLRGKNLNLVDQKRFDLTDLRLQKNISQTLLRVEIAIASEMPKEVLQALARDLQQQLPKFRKTVDAKIYVLAKIYLSRLQFAAGLYPQSFALSQEVLQAKKQFWGEWPDQIYILFPQPFQNIVKEQAATHGVEDDLIYAIARQESSFNATVESPAGAIGLMQLIPPTAQRLAKDLGKIFEPMHERLKEPAVNIQLGSAYLKLLSRYYNGNNPAVFGAYNAGEFAVDSWLERRKHRDPLLWIELIPFGETHTYVKHVWRNKEIYRFIGEMGSQWAFDFALAGDSGPKD